MIFSLPVDLCWLIFLALVSIGIGEKILVRFFRFEFPSVGFRLLFASGTGFAFFSYLTFVLGFVGGLYRWVYFPLLLFIFLVCLSEIKESLPLFGEALREIKESISQPFDYFLLALFVSVVAGNFIFAYSPPTQVRELLYDLNFPRSFLKAHKIVNLDDRHLFFFPLQIQFTYLMAMTVKNVLVAKLINFLFGIYLTGVIYFLCRYLFGVRAALFSVVILYITPLMTSLSGSANIDLGKGFYGLLSVSAFIFWIKSKNDRYLYLSAVMAGITAGSKVSGVPVAFTIGILAFLRLAMLKEQPKAIFGKLSRVFLLGLAAFSPWIFRNVVFSGNPMAPYPIPVLGIEGHEYAMLEINTCRIYEKLLTFKDYFDGYHNFVFGDVIYGPGPLIFAFLLPAFFSDEKKRNVWILFLFAALNYVFINGMLFYPHRFYETRYYIVSYSLFALLTGVGLDQMLKYFWKPAVLKSFVALALLFPAIAFSSYMSFTRLRLFFGLQSQDSYIRQKLPFFHLVDFGNKNIPADATVVSLGNGDCHFYYWNARVMEGRLWLVKQTDETKILAGLKKDKAGYVVLPLYNFYPVDPSGVYRHRQFSAFDVRWNIPKFIQKKILTEIYSHENIIVYKINYPQE